MSRFPAFDSLLRAPWPAGIDSLLYISFFFSLAFFMPAVSSISLALLLLSGLFNRHRKKTSLFIPVLRQPFYLLCSLLFLCLCFSSLAHSENWSALQVPVGLLLTPLAWSGSHQLLKEQRAIILAIFVLFAAAAALLCIGTAAFHFYSTGEISFFFYHALAQPIGGHAIYPSAVILFAVVLLNQGEAHLVFGKRIAVALLIVLVIFQVLLASKFFIGATLTHLLLLAGRKGLASKNRKAMWLTVFTGLALGIGLLATNNPVAERFRDLVRNNGFRLSQSKFDPGIYFNGLEFRLLQWRITPELLNENQSWWTGLGSAHSQAALDRKYRELNMYTGAPSRGDTGYLGYDSHNQFLSSLLTGGLPSLILLVIACSTLLWKTAKKKNSALLFLSIILVSWMFTESILQRQYGILLFTLLPLFHWFEED